MIGSVFLDKGRYNIHYTVNLRFFLFDLVTCLNIKSEKGTTTISSINIDNFKRNLYNVIDKAKKSNHLG